MKRLIVIPLLLLLIMPSTAHGQDVVGDLLGRINALRQSQGMPGYSLNGALNAAAQNHASWMASTGQVSHTQSDGSTPTVRAQRAGYASTWVSENIYMGTNATAATAWQWWVNSPVHYRGITSANYTEVGIAAVTGANGTAFVLVFGSPGPPAVVPQTRAGSAGGRSGAAAPSFVVGVDNYGNIMHEIQPGQTLGHIAFIYGYDWDDLERIRQINQMTEEEGRRLSIGAVLLVPPWDGTYTPTPGEPPTVTPTPGAELAEALAAGSGDPEAGPELPPLQITLSPVPTPEQEAIGTSAVVPEWVIQTAIAQGDYSPLTPEAPPASNEQMQANAVSWSAATVTPTPGPVEVADAAGSIGDAADPGLAAVVAPRTQVAAKSRGSVSPLMIGAVALQVTILGAAGFEFARRSRRKRP